jgi:hypothetical protein
MLTVTTAGSPDMEYGILTVLESLLRVRLPIVASGEAQTVDATNANAKKTWQPDTFFFFTAYSLYLLRCRRIIGS